MIRTRSKRVLLVAPKVFPDELLSGYLNVKHVSSISSIFPSIHETKPDVVFFDYELLGNNAEKTFRRLQTNPYYRSIKICLYKTTENTKTDSLLRILGVDHIVYHEDLQKISKRTAALNAIRNLIDASLINLVVGVASN